MIRTNRNQDDMISHAIKTYNIMANVMNDNNITIIDTLEVIPIFMAYNYESSSEEEFSHDLYLLTQSIRIFRDLVKSGHLAKYQPNDDKISE